ncbi:MAG: bifunctional methylenetetrahydrofolate dehydrogenase/methenyltetrahydrofolate cyclohydrolase FolD [Desulfonauticus sp.]|nr:bifunctional methylenetetrahydrofolate dehydrogenase/methenyltetrahydrofolate cyclohydrolase FolD [Desulfonauticus sp.]
MILLDGKKTALAIRQKLKKEITQYQHKGHRAPGLAVILVGDDPASHIYVRNKEQACAEVGIVSRSYRLDSSTPQDELENLIKSLNDDPEIDGILLQLPLPAGFHTQRCLDLISPSKDVDGFHPDNVGRLALNLPGLRSCTPAGVMSLLKQYNLSVRGKKAVVIGCSNIVGKPLSLLLLNAEATVTVCHAATYDLKAEVIQGDFVFVAIGQPKFISADMIKEGAVVVDIGINRTENGIVGDCDFEALTSKVKAITPVPGGVGPMTIAQLLLNTVSAYKIQLGI